MFWLALELHKTVEEIERMRFSEFQEWLAFFEIRKKETEKNGRT